MTCFQRLLGGRSRDRRSVEGLFCRVRDNRLLSLWGGEGILAWGPLAFKWTEQGRCRLLSAGHAKADFPTLCQVWSSLECKWRQRGPSGSRSFPASARNQGIQEGRMWATGLEEQPERGVLEKRLPAPRCVPHKATSRHQGHQPGSKVTGRLPQTR